MEADEIEATAAEIERFLKALADTPRRLASASRGFDDARMHLKPDKTSWSANDGLAHLRACADVWGKSIMSMLAEDNPTLPYVSPRTWIRRTNYPGLAFHESLRAFTEQRNELLSILKSLAFQDWSRSATIDGRKHTVFTQARRMALHETEHCEQIEELLK